MYRLFVALLLAGAAAQAVGFEAPGEAALALKAQPDLRWKSTDISSAAVTVLPAPDAARIDALRRENSGADTKLLKIGFEREIAREASSSDAALKWRATGGGQVATLRVTSRDAIALRVALELDGLPNGAELRFAGNKMTPAAELLIGAAEVERQRAVQPLYWTPVTEGDTQTIEIFLPAAADTRWFKPRLIAASHLFVSPTGTLAGTKIGESGACEYDAKCVTNPSTAYQNAKNAVARMVFQTGSSSALCTGTLLNDTDANTQTPYFFGAAHCFTSQSIASTLTTFWFYEATGCGSGVLDTNAARQVSGGATVLYANAPSDVLFLRLNNSPPSGAYYLGWNSTTLTTGASILVLHHPQGDVKKVSLGEVTGFGGSNLQSGNFIQVGYTDGTTEGGSSGCGLLTNNGSEYLLRGGLLGGTAGCANTGSISNPENRDDFSRFDQAFPNLQTYLQPSTSQPPSPIDYTGAWYNPQQSGWGYVILRGASGAYAIYIYHYDNQNSPSWYLSAGTLSGTNYNAVVRTYSGPWFGITPFNPSAVTNQVSGNLSINFTSATTATTSFTIDGRTVTTTLNKLSF